MPLYFDNCFRKLLDRYRLLCWNRSEIRFERKKADEFDLLRKTLFKFCGDGICSDLRFVLNPGLKHPGRVVYAAFVTR